MNQNRQRKALVSFTRGREWREEEDGWRYPRPKQARGKVWGEVLDGDRSAATVELAAAPYARGGPSGQGTRSPG